jgi:hypothetical protein
VGVTERGVFLSGFETIFQLAYGVRGAPMWELFQEMSVGFAGLYGRQLTTGGSDALLPETASDLAELVSAANAGKVTLIGDLIGPLEYKYRPADGLWYPAPLPGKPNPAGLLTWQLLAMVSKWQGQALTVTAHLNPGVTIGGADRQPLLDVDPDEKAIEEIGTLLAIPRPAPEPGQSFRVGALYVDPAAQVLVDGAPCPACSIAPGSTENGSYLDVTLAAALPLGTHVIQVLNPDGWASNELPIQVEWPEVSVSDATLACIEAAGCLVAADPLACAALAGCEPLPASIVCEELEEVPGCAECALLPDCSDGTCRPVETVVSDVEFVPDACPDPEPEP